MTGKKQIIISTFMIILLANVALGYAGMEANDAISSAPKSVYKVIVDDYYGFYQVINIEPGNITFKYENNTLNINAGDSVIWENQADNNYELTIISEQNLWDSKSGYLKYNYRSFNYTFMQPGTYQISIKEEPRIRHQTIIIAPPEQGKFRVGPSVTLRPVTDVIEANQDGIVELFMNNPSLNEVTLNVDVRVSVPSGIHVYGQSFGQGAGAGVVAGTFSVPPGTSRTIILVVKADKSARIASHTIQFTGLYWPGNNKENYQPLSLTYSVTVKEPSKNPDSPESSNPEDVKGTPTPATPVPTSTIQMPDVKIRAQLRVTYEVGSLKNNRVTIKVFLKNMGDATASNINLTIEHPHELEPIAVSGSEKIGDTIAWKGELSPNEEHISEYSVKVITGKDIEIPLKVTYAKITPEEKARALGISPYAAEASINPQDLETILVIIKILKEISGFTALAAIMILALVTIILKNEKA